MKRKEQIDANLDAILKPACDQCPFRTGSIFKYDRDAMEALNDGLEPSCHILVGAYAIFHDPFTTTKRCRGYDAWVENKRGFTKPKCSDVDVSRDGTTTTVIPSLAPD